MFLPGDLYHFGTGDTKRVFGHLVHLDARFPTPFHQAVELFLLLVVQREQVSGTGFVVALDVVCRDVVADDFQRVPSGIG